MKKVLPSPNSEWINLRLPPEFQISDPTFQQDWNIFGQDIQTAYRDLRLVPPSHYDRWNRERIGVIRELNWVGTKLFKNLHNNTLQTDRVLLRIIASKLNNVLLPDSVDLNMSLHLHMIHCYRKRRYVYDEYVSEMLDIPF